MNVSKKFMSNAGARIAKIFQIKTRSRKIAQIFSKLHVFKSVVVDDKCASFYVNGKLIEVKLSENLFFDDGVSYSKAAFQYLCTNEAYRFLQAWRNILQTIHRPAVKKKKTGKFATGAEVLEKLESESPVVGDILKYRLYQKLHSTYLEGFKPLIDKKTGIAAFSASLLQLARQIPEKP